MKMCNAHIILIIAFFSLNLSLLANIDFNINAPKSIKAGETCIIEITISKTDINGFSKFETTFPNKFQIEGIKFSGATFINKENKAKFIWVNLPNEEEFIISYKVTIPESYKGKLNLNNIFYYIENRTKKSIKKNTRIIVVNENIIADVKDVSPLYTDASSIKKRILADLKFNIRQKVIFKVQLSAFKNDFVPKDFLDELCEKEFNLKNIKQDGLNKYYVGDFYSLKVAEMFLKYSGVKGAFIIAMHNGKKITIEEAKKLTK